MRVISLLRRQGRLADLEWATLQSAVHFLQFCRQDGASLTIAVNVSAESLRLPGFGLRLHELLQLHDIPGAMLRLEIVEWTEIVERDVVDANIAQLLAAGVTLSLDDFGAGYSTLILLSQLAIAEVKIEQALIATLSDAKSQSIVRFIVEVAHRCGAIVVAEGTETLAQEQHLRALGVMSARAICIRPPCRPTSSAASPPARRVEPQEHRHRRLGHARALLFVQWRLPHRHLRPEREALHQPVQLVAGKFRIDRAQPAIGDCRADPRTLATFLLAHAADDGLRTLRRVDDLGHRDPRQVDEVGIAEQVQLLPQQLQQLPCSGWSGRYGSASLATLRSHSSSRIIENSASLLGKWLYTVRLETPATSAMRSMLVAS